MVALTCEHTINRDYLNHYNLDDEKSLNAFHTWVGKNIFNELVKKYGNSGLGVIPQHEIWDHDSGLISDCDFQELCDGSILVTFYREQYPQRGILSEEDLTMFADGTLELNFYSDMARAEYA